MRILAIETSCDETAIALVEATGGLRAPRFKVLKNIISSQIEVHRPWGGVVPNLAKREHAKNLPIIFNRIMNNELRIKNKTIIHNSKFLIPDIVVVTVGPGLEPALWTGIEFAKEIHKNYFPEAKLIGVNHLEGHLYSFLLSQKTGSTKHKAQSTKSFGFPAIALLVSGGHTILLKMDSLTKWKKLGETRDDAAGEAFDKVAKMLGLPYPGGPEIEKLAKLGNPGAIPFPRPMLHSKDYNFSFSGLKTSVLYYIREHTSPINADQHQRGFAQIINQRKSAFAANIAASFQQAAIEVLVKKTERAAREFGTKSILLSGGVAANKELRKELLVISHKLSVNFMAPPMKFNTDNAVMIAAAGYISHLQKKNRRFIAQGNMSI